MKVLIIAFIVSILKSYKFEIMRYLSLTGPDIENGLGCRITLWVPGCAHKCPGCHNPETWNWNQGKSIDYQTIINELNKPYIQGLTISGGDPFFYTNLDDVYQLCRYIKQVLPEKDIWIYTGDTYEDIIKNKNMRFEILKYIDVLVEGPFILEKRDITLPYTGSSNQRIIDIKQSLQNNNITLLDLKDNA